MRGRRWLGRWLAVALLVLGPVAAARAAGVRRIEVKVVVFSQGSGPDDVSFVYSTPARGAPARQELETRARDDFRRLAAAFGQPAASVQISTLSNPVQAPPTTSAEGKLRGVVNRAAGWLNIGPFLQVFRRYQRLSLTFFVEPPFRFRGPQGPWNDPALAMTLDREGVAYTYDVRLRHPGGKETLPTFAAPSGSHPGAGKWVYLLVALIALAAGVAVYALLQYWVEKKVTSN